MLASGMTTAGCGIGGGGGLEASSDRIAGGPPDTSATRLSPDALATEGGEPIQAAGGVATGLPPDATAESAVAKMASAEAATWLPPDAAPTDLAYVIEPSPTPTNSAAYPFALVDSAW